MFDREQIVKIKWNNTNRDWYESRGYVFTKRNDVLEVKAKDLCVQSKQNVEAICDYCGANYFALFYILQQDLTNNRKNACSKCAGLKASDVSRTKRAKKNFDIIKHICDNNGYRLITDESDYTDVKMNIQYECPKHGVQTTILDNMRAGHRCFFCSYTGRADSIKLDVDYVEGVISSINNNKWLNKSEYTNCLDRNLLIRCECGNTYTTSFYNFSRYGINRCHVCSLKESSGEYRIRKYLEKNGLKFEQEKRFRDCRDSKPLPFDFYLPDKMACIEFDGQQHFVNKFGDKSFEMTKRHDEIKNKYCSDNNIILIRIPYFDGNRIEQILDEKLCLV